MRSHELFAAKSRIRKSVRSIGHRGWMAAARRGLSSGSTEASCTPPACAPSWIEPVDREKRVERQTRPQQRQNNNHGRRKLLTSSSPRKWLKQAENNRSDGWCTLAPYSKKRPPAVIRTTQPNANFGAMGGMPILYWSQQRGRTIESARCCLRHWPVSDDAAQRT